MNGGGELKTLVPTVQWGQRKDMVVLRVQIVLPDDQASNVSVWGDDRWRGFIWSRSRMWEHAACVHDRRDLCRVMDRVVTRA